MKLKFVSENHNGDIIVEKIVEGDMSVSFNIVSKEEKSIDIDFAYNEYDEVVDSGFVSLFDVVGGDNLIRHFYVEVNGKYHEIYNTDAEKMKFDFVISLPGDGTEKAFIANIRCKW